MMDKSKNKGSYQPEIIKPVIRITDDLPPYWLIRSRSPQQEYTILCDLDIKGRAGHLEPRSMEVTVYYNRKLLQMDQAAEDLIREYLTPVTYELPDDDQEEDAAFQSVINRFGEAAASELSYIQGKIQYQVREWAYTQMAQVELREPVAYMVADNEPSINYRLPDDLYMRVEGMRCALSNSGLKSEYWEEACYIAGYLKGSRERDKPVPPLIVSPTIAILELINHDIWL